MNNHRTRSLISWAIYFGCLLVLFAVFTALLAIGPASPQTTTSTTVTVPVMDPGRKDEHMIDQAIAALEPTTTTTTIAPSPPAPAALPRTE